jgi:hypothetical protein
VNKLTVMVGKGSPRLNMVGRVSPKHNRFLPVTTAIKKKSVGSPKGVILLVIDICLLSIFTISTYCLSIVLCRQKESKLEPGH